MGLVRRGALLLSAPALLSNIVLGWHGLSGASSLAHLTSLSLMLQANKVERFSSGNSFQTGEEKVYYIVTRTT